MIEYTGTGAVNHGPCLGRMGLHPHVGTGGDWPQTHIPVYDNPRTLEEAYADYAEAEAAAATGLDLASAEWDAQLARDWPECVDPEITG